MEELLEAGHPPDIWIQDLTRGSFSRLTRGPASNFNPIWTPDGKLLSRVSTRPLKPESGNPAQLRLLIVKIFKGCSKLGCTLRWWCALGIPARFESAPRNLDGPQSCPSTVLLSCIHGSCNATLW